MVFLSTLGNHGMIFIVLGIVLLLLGIKYKNLLFTGIRLFLCLSTTALVCNVILKPWVARIRPYDILGFPIAVPPLADYSFPSGHTSAAFAAARAIYAYHKQGDCSLWVCGLYGHFPFVFGCAFPIRCIDGGLCWGL